VLCARLGVEDLEPQDVGFRAAGHVSDVPGDEEVPLEQGPGLGRERALLGLAEDPVGDRMQAHGPAVVDVQAEAEESRGGVPHVSLPRAA
jgi:hypothetical protein